MALDGHWYFFHLTNLVLCGHNRFSLKSSRTNSTHTERKPAADRVAQVRFSRLSKLDLAPLADRPGGRRGPNPIHSSGERRTLQSQIAARGTPQWGRLMVSPWRAGLTSH